MVATIESSVTSNKAELQRTDEQLQHLTKARERAEASGEKEIASLKVCSCLWRKGQLRAW